MVNLSCLWCQVVQVFELDEYHEELVVVHEEVLKYIQVFHMIQICDLILVPL